MAFIRKINSVCHILNGKQYCRQFTLNWNRPIGLGLKSISHSTCANSHKINVKSVSAHNKQNCFVMDTKVISDQYGQFYNYFHSFWDSQKRNNKTVTMAVACGLAILLVHCSQNMKGMICY